MAQPSHADSAAERAYRRIRDDILEGTHQPGTMLGESSLAAALGMSRTPVRAALGRLQEEGWITVYPKRGALVRGMDERNVAELADARFILETTGVSRASAQRRERLADRLRAMIPDQREALAADDLRRFIDLTIRFHRGFVEAGGSEVLLELYDRLADRHRFILFASGDRVRARGDAIIVEHEALTERLREGAAAEFADVLREHIAEVPAEAAGPFPPGQTPPPSW